LHASFAHGAVPDAKAGEADLLALRRLSRAALRIARGPRHCGHFGRRAGDRARPSTIPPR
jgi:hypothetical protein